MSDLPNSDPCMGIDWVYQTDATLGGATQEWEEAANPDDLTTPLSADECVIDTIGAILIKDAVTGCIKGAEAGIAIGSHPLVFTQKRLRFRHLTPGERRRLKKKLNIQ